MWKSIIFSLLACETLVAATPTTQPTTSWKLKPDAPVGLSEAWKWVQANKTASVLNARGDLARLEQAQRTDRRNRDIRNSVAQAKKTLAEAEAPSPIAWPELMTHRKQPGSVGCSGLVMVRTILGPASFVGNPVFVVDLGDGPLGPDGRPTRMSEERVSDERVLVSGFETSGIQVGQKWSSPEGLLVMVGQEQLLDGRYVYAWERFDPAPHFESPSTTTEKPRQLR